MNGIPLSLKCTNADADAETGLVIVNGRIRGGTGLLAEGVFIEQVIPDSIADQDGR